MLQLYTNECAYMFRYVVDDDMLQIMNVNLSDQGMYTCIARTSVDQDNATSLLTVLGEMVKQYYVEYHSLLITLSLKSQ